MTIATLTPAEAQAQIAQGARLIDIRDADEYAREHIPDAELVPLATLTSGAPLNARAGETVIFHCQAGSRTQNNAIRLAAAEMFLSASERASSGKSTTGRLSTQ